MIPSLIIPVTKNRN